MIRIFIIEFNQFIPFDVNFEDTTEQFIGNSVLAICNHGLSNKYELIGATVANLIFIDKSYNNGEIENIDISEVYKKVKPLRLGHNWKGEMLFFKNNKLSIKEYFTHPQQKNFILFQPIPKFLRKMSNIDGTGAKKLKIIYSHIALFLFRPNLFFAKMFNKIKNLGTKKNN